MNTNIRLQFSEGWGYFMQFHMNFSNFIHTVSVFLTLSLAIWRFIMIKFPTQSVELCTVEKCKVVLGLGYGKYVNIELDRKPAKSSPRHSCVHVCSMRF